MKTENEEREIPKYVRHNVQMLLQAIKYAPTEDLEAVRAMLVEAAKTTIDIEMAQRARYGK